MRSDVISGCSSVPTDAGGGPCERDAASPERQDTVPAAQPARAHGVASDRLRGRHGRPARRGPASGRIRLRRCASPTSAWPSATTSRHAAVATWTNRCGAVVQTAYLATRDQTERGARDGGCQCQLTVRRHDVVGGRREDSVVGTVSSWIHGRESNRQISRPASTSLVQSWPTSSPTQPMPRGRRHTRGSMVMAVANAGRLGGGRGQEAAARRQPGQEPLTTRPMERGAGGAQHQPIDESGVAAPQQLGDRTAHRVADGDASLDAQDVERVRRRRRRSPPSGTVPTDRSPRPWPRWSSAITRNCPPAGRSSATS